MNEEEFIKKMNKVKEHLIKRCEWIGVCGSLNWVFVSERMKILFDEVYRCESRSNRAYWLGDYVKCNLQKRLDYIDLFTFWYITEELR